MRKLSSTAIFFSLFLCIPSLAQQKAIVELRGRVVEVSNGQSIGIPGIKVSVIGGNYDITVKNGEFKLIVPTGKDYIKILIDNTDKKLLKPYAGFVNLPPSGNLDIIVCAQENRKLQAKVNDLNAQIQRLENKNELSKKQLVAMHSEMLDTILHYEQIIQGLNQQIEAKGGALKDKENEINRLSNQLQEVVQQLVRAREEQFLRQQALFKDISSTLKGYDNALNNLNVRLHPSQIAAYFNIMEANKVLTDKLNAYNNAFKIIYEQHDAHISGVKHYWENNSLARNLQETYDYILQDVHDKVVFPLNTTVVDNIQKYGAKKVTKNAAQKEATRGAEYALPKLSVQIPTMENKINTIINQLKQDF